MLHFSFLFPYLNFIKAQYYNFWLNDFFIFRSYNFLFNIYVNNIDLTILFSLDTFYKYFFFNDFNLNDLFIYFAQSQKGLIQNQNYVIKKNKCFHLFFLNNFFSLSNSSLNSTFFFRYKYVKKLFELYFFLEFYNNFFSLFRLWFNDLFIFDYLNNAYNFHFFKFFFFLFKNNFFKQNFLDKLI